ncbi:neutral zinc metallopeptidase [Siccirubricoccus sp. KC 17139]|uniref:Neutral zinc metallopeptidase n=1 Tax=Siccirubricoccus soli TaxID=2899147 RepID=A0ABT1D4Z0_9PROT|nr:neutral zinc metallopeptidase [Siccirubricoccus soli]MCO6416350.1 neutral zinc metallopeptidase [Siccirubricoccus soli]MCP2682484.1 neutral zinc metallopeptidase [Siccirubricoccus soli]
MRLEGERESSNVEDRRGGGGLPIGLAGGGIGTVALVVIALLLGVDPSFILNGGGDAGPERQVVQTGPGPDGAQEPERRFVAQVLATTEDAWGEIFRRGGQRYAPPSLILFTGATQSGCGFAQSAVGPFYCPEDRRVYLDLGFFRDMERQLGAPGDFARAYVIAHEVGHHVQNQLGILDRVNEARRRMDERSSNALQVRIELQADCFAGIWARQTQRVLEPGDIEEGINAAAAVGDDRLQRRARGTVVPESFTHGSSAQRVRWFRRGLDSGDPRQCDSFAAESL